MADRDPRINPKLGDRIFKEGRRDVTLVRIVTGRCNETVFYKSSEDGKVRIIFMTNWIDWAREASISSVGDGDEGVSKI